MNTTPTWLKAVFGLCIAIVLFAVIKGGKTDKAAEAEAELQKLRLYQVLKQHEPAVLNRPGFSRHTPASRNTAVHTLPATAHC